MADPTQQFVHVLRPVPALCRPEAWTERENCIVEEHFRRLQALLTEGRLILAGKTDGLDARTFGLVLFEAASEEEARAIMAADPAVAGGIMTAELFPYRVALSRKGLA